jgi:hypothetical protein
MCGLKIKFVIQFKELFCQVQKGWFVINIEKGDAVVGHRHVEHQKKYKKTVKSLQTSSNARI